jgi:hypothetical protein
MSTLSKSHRHAIPDDGPCHREPLPEEAALLVLLEAAKLAAHDVLDGHQGEASTQCACCVCRNAQWLIHTIELGSSCIDGELPMGDLYKRVRIRGAELAANPW